LEIKFLVLAQSLLLLTSLLNSQATAGFMLLSHQERSQVAQQPPQRPMLACSGQMLRVKCCSVRPRGYWALSRNDKIQNFNPL